MDGLTGIAIKDKLGVRCSDTGEIVFEDCKVPKENLIGKEGQGFAIAESSLAYGRTNIAARSLGIAQAAVDASIRYAKEREQFGKKIGDFQMNKQIIADMVANTEASRLLVYRSAWLQDKGRPSALESTIAKFFASEGAVQSVIGASKIHGAYTYSAEYPIARLYRDVMLMTAGEGTSNIQRIIIANNALGFKK
jgi:alkylation response protein AidB-like acyl-CoA dehydrogenase